MPRLTREQSQALTREKLLRSARDVVARDGYDGASIERIAEEAGYSKGAFYSNFSSKEDVLLKLLEENAGTDVDELSELLQEVSEPAEVIDIVVAWSDARAAEQTWGLIAIDFLRRARRSDADDPRQRELFVDQWAGVGSLLIDKLAPDVDFPGRPVDVGGIVMELTYGGISAFLGVNTAGQMIRIVLEALVTAHQLADA